MTRALELFVALCIGAAVGAGLILAMLVHDLAPLMRWVERERRK